MTKVEGNFFSFLNRTDVYVKAEATVSRQYEVCLTFNNHSTYLHIAK